MQLRKLLQTEERGVSPVIGVILMVAITVILAAVIASFVLGLGGEQEVAPTAQFDFNYDNSSNTLGVTHTSGDTVRADRLIITGENIDSSGGASYSSGQNWQASHANGSISGEPAVRSGDTTTVGVGSDDFVVRIVWESASGETTSELASHEGPGYE